MNDILKCEVCGTMENIISPHLNVCFSCAHEDHLDELDNINGKDQLELERTS
jgi:hypothetical protein